MLNWIYNLYKTRLTYKLGKLAMVAYVTINKPERYLNNEDRTVLETLCNHFANAGYCVIVQD